MILIDAVNICLRYIGETPVPSGVDIDSLDPLHEAYIARTMLQEVSRELQTQGWWFNREEETFIPDTSNRIGLSPKVLSFISDENVIDRGGTLYDRDNQTFEFTDSITATVIWEWDFEELPISFASYVTYETAKQLQIFLNGDSYVDTALEKKINKALIMVEKENLRFMKYNLVSGTRLISRTDIPEGVS